MELAEDDERGDGVVVRGDERAVAGGDDGVAQPRAGLEVAHEGRVLRGHVVAHGQQVGQQVVLGHADAERGVERGHERRLRARLAKKSFASARALVGQPGLGHAVGRPALHEDAHALVVDVGVAALAHALEDGDALSDRGRGVGERGRGAAPRRGVEGPRGREALRVRGGVDRLAARGLDGDVHGREPLLVLAP